MRVTRPAEGSLPTPPSTQLPGEGTGGPARASQGARAVDSASFARILRGVGQELDRGEALSASAIRGGGQQGTLSAQELIGLQAGVYRYSEALDLVTKLVDRGTQAVKTTLQNQ